MKSSVALCTYNGAKFLKEQLDSIEAQTVSVDEIIICDDASTDETVRIAEEFKAASKAEVKIYINETNLKSTKNFEKAISLCTGEFVFLCDQDDIWEKNKVESMLHAQQETNADIVFSDAYLNKGGKILRISLWDTLGISKKIRADFNQNALDYGARSFFLTGACALFRRTYMLECMPFPVQTVHDLWLFINFLLRGYRVVMLDEKLIQYRLHSGQQIGTRPKKRKKAKRLLSLPILVKFHNEYNLLVPEPYLSESELHLKLAQKREEIIKLPFIKRIWRVIGFYFKKGYSRTTKYPFLRACKDIIKPVRSQRRHKDFEIY
ncbi:MAG: glycosyltransferase family 2 protein [Firmicutes bacterium]|nr:glycosyltransferase family 2 protein [Bacillota bacterium]